MTDHHYKYPRPAVSADCVLFSWDRRRLNVLLIKRGAEPFEGQWALPGGFVNDDEDLDDAPLRELFEETGLQDVQLQQHRTYGALQRDPRTRVITVVYLGMMKASDQVAVAADDAEDARWFPLNELPNLAFDHQQIINDVTSDLRLRLRCQPFGKELLPETFSLDELQTLYEALLGQKLDANKFGEQLNSAGILVAAENELHRFDLSAYAAALQNGTSFDPE